MSFLYRLILTPQALPTAFQACHRGTFCWKTKCLTMSLRFLGKTVICTINLRFKENHISHHEFAVFVGKQFFTMNSLFLGKTFFFTMNWLFFFEAGLSTMNLLFFEKTIFSTVNLLVFGENNVFLMNLCFLRKIVFLQ